MNDFVELGAVIRILVRRWWILLLGMILGGAIGYLVSINQTPVYRATTSLFVGRPIQSAQLNRFDVENSLQLAAIYADIARRQPVLESTVAELGLGTSWFELRNRVRTAVSDNTQLLEISVEAESFEEARLTADEISRQLILLSPTGTGDAAREEALSFTREQLATLRERITHGQNRIEELELELLAQSSAQGEIADVEQEISTLETLVARWQGTYAQMLEFVNGEQPANNLAVLEPAQGGNAPVRPRVLLNTLIGMMVGFALAFGTVFLLEFLDDTVKTPEDLERLLNIRTLGAINNIRGKGLHGSLIINQDSFSDAYEDYRLLRSKVQFIAMEGGPGYCVMVTSPARGEGKSVTSANLGVVMAQAGYRTIVIDANLRQPVLHELFNLQNQTGLTYLLRSSETDVNTQLRTTLVPNLKVLVSGPQPQNPSELLGLKRMDELLARLRGIADIVIVDAPEVVTVADASVLSKKVDGVLLVVESGTTKRNESVQAVTNLRDAHAPIIGGVLNRLSSPRRMLVSQDSLPKAQVFPQDSRLTVVDTATE